MIHVCFGLYDKTGRYSKFTGTTMLSLFESHNPPSLRLPSITVHILHDNTLTQDNRDKFIYMAGQYGQLVKFYNVEQHCADTIEMIKRVVPISVNTRFSIGAFYRLFTLQLLPKDITKLIYLDSDIIVQLDINEFWQIELGDKPIAAVPEMDMGATVQRLHNLVFLCRENFVRYEDYFNSGVLFMNLKILREEEKNIWAALDFARAQRQLYFSDQDILNYCFSTRALKLPVKFNKSCGSSREEKEPIIEGKIHHYGGDNIGLDRNDIFSRLWMRHFMKTPWFDEETIGRLYAKVQQLHVGFKQTMVTLSVAMSGKTRGFFVVPGDVDWLKNFFSIRDDEEIIPAENNDSLRKLFDAMNASRGKKIFFIMLPKFPLQILTQAGFVQGRDFLNGLEFLSEPQSDPQRAHEFLKAI